MDKVKALELLRHLEGRSIDGWIVEEFIDNGKSAAVFKARSGKELSAVKIFDDELIAKYGDDKQLARIDRELSLIGKRHDNLVTILGGGFDKITENHYIIMEYLPGANLRRNLQDIPAERVPQLVFQLARAAEYLEGLGLVHRDIKPDNIVILDEFSRLVLLDLGVIRPISGSDLTDASGIQEFIGTLQYSSPEFLLREEEDSPDGWRSLTFYQIGGVLYDLIMRRPLFAEFANPYARLVNAVQRVTPEIQNSAVDNYLVEVARCCLLKDWRMRLRLVDWSSFLPRKSDVSGQSAKQRVTNRGALALERGLEENSVRVVDISVSARKLAKETVRALTEATRSVRAENTAMPPLRILAKTPGEDAFAVEFAEARNFGLNQKLTICIRVDVLDVAARVVSIGSCGCVGEFEPGEAKSWVSIFEGTYDSVSLFEALERCMYAYIDQAQTLGEHADGPTWLQTIQEES